MSDPAWRLVRVVAPRFVAGMLVDPKTRTVKETAPILKRWRGRSWDDTWRKMRARGWKVEALPERS